MKKVFFLLCLSLAFVMGYSQSSFKTTASNPNGVISDTGIDTLSYRTTVSYQTVSIQPKITKTTGTMAGTAVLYSSVNGVDYVPTDTLTLTNIVTNTIIWEKKSACRYWRIIIGGATTVAATGLATISASN